MSAPLSLQPEAGRFARLQAIEWWDQSIVANARVLVVGAGALGNEIVKNLALLGIGHVVVADMDHIELSNLSRSVLFREADEGKPKANQAATAAREIYPGIDITPVQGNVLAELGLGYFRWANVVIGALDNRETRVFVNSACARVGRPWVDGGIDVLHGVVRGFAPPTTACYECTMSQVDWDLLNKRRSCSLLARRALANRGTPTTPTTASIIAGLQVQEVVKLLHHLDPLLGRGLVFDGEHHSSYLVSYPVEPSCPWHEAMAPIEALPAFNSDSLLQEIWEEGTRRLGGMEALDLSRELVTQLACPKCGHVQPVFQPIEKITEDQARCGTCGTEASPEFLHSISAGSHLLEKSAAQLGLPSWDILWARNGDRAIGFELAGDDPFVKAKPVNKEASDVLC